MACAVVERSRKKERSYDLDPVQRNVLAVPLVDLKGDCTGAISLGRGCHRLARATHVAAAIFNVSSFDRPISACHDVLPTNVDADGITIRVLLREARLPE
jgi:hypothetical protein